jgi:hypothetical protein
MQDSRVRVVFANSVARPLLQRADGYTQGRNIYITHEAIDDHPDRNLIKEEFLPILIHEIIHGETAALPQHHLVSLGRQMVWRRLSGPDLIQDSLYTDYFRSDEAEAHFASWQVTTDREQTEHHRALATEFCLLQNRMASSYFRLSPSKLQRPNRLPEVILCSRPMGKTFASQPQSISNAGSHNSKY